MEALGIAVDLVAFAAVVVGQAQAFGLAPLLKGRFPVVEMGIGLEFGGRALPVGREPAVHRFQGAPDPVEGANHGLAGLGPQGGPAAFVTGGDRADTQHRLDLAGLAQFRQPAVAHELGPQGGALAHL